MSELTPEEVEKLKKLLPLVPYAPEIQQEAEYRKAFSTVRRRWQVVAGAFIAFSAALIAGWDNFKDFIAWLAR